MSKRLLAVSMIAMTVFAAGCEQKPAASAPRDASTPASAAELPAGIFLAGPPKEAAEVKDAKPGAKVGDKVTLIGRIGGSEDPFVESRAIFTLVDQRMKACGEGTKADSCRTPWDYCCEPQDELTANMVTVRVVGADGQPLKTALMNIGGLKPLARVAVVGTVAQTEGGAVVVNANGLYVTK